MSKVFLITGAGRGMGTEIARAALKDGHRVVATGRRPEAVEEAVGGPCDDLLVTRLDVTEPQDAQDAVAAALDRFGRIDVLVNNAGTFCAGHFEEVSPERMRAQLETNLFGPMNVTRAVLPTLREQRSGHIMTLSSFAGLVGQEFCAAYSTSKFAVEGWMESLRYDVKPFGIDTTIVEPGLFRTELLADASTTWPDVAIDDYAERTAEQLASWKALHGDQPGDPARIARALLGVAALEHPPLRFVAGDDAIATALNKASELSLEAEESRGLGSLLSFDDPDL
ncbi:SDR family oxidoreductase [Actinomadura flavalba]|uniref:SDR family oxidoreductase n=1 Tax=Actinomadura flavalba TaxID=1120938 RepID=UPI00037BE7BC|nr:SDR family oxidoreductase [Actinomadura flavalba]